MIICLFLVSVNSYHIERGIINGSVQLPCRINNSQPVDWKYCKNIKDKKTFVIIGDVPMRVYRERFNIEKTCNFRNLTINNLQMSDTGLYYCMDDGGLGVTHNPIYLIVINYVVANDTLNVTVGDTMNLMCPFDSPEWLMLRGNTLVSIQSHNMKNVSLFYTGIYFCFKDEYWYSVKLVVSDKPCVPTICISTNIDISTISLYAIISVLTISNAMTIVFCCRKKLYLTFFTT